MNIHIWGILIGYLVGSGCAFLALLLISPMGGNLIETSVLPYLIGPSLLGGLLAQSVFVHSQKGANTES